MILYDSTCVTGILGTCSRFLYALRILRSPGHSNEALQVVSRSTTVARLIYAALAWWEFVLVSADRQRLERFVTRTRRMGYLPTDVTNVGDMVLSAEACSQPACCRLLKPFTFSSYLFPSIGHSPTRWSQIPSVGQ